MKARFFAFYAILWLLLVTFAFYWQIRETKHHAETIATRQAEMFFDYIVLIKRWNASHGGVYAPITPDNQPNPYLDVPNRDVITTDGVPLTLIDPAYMTRQLAALQHDSTGIDFHITSLKTMRSENAADEWETQALRRFEQGEKSFSGLTQLRGAPYYRYMAPFLVEESCLLCHKAQGFKVGDMRGGISVGIPAASIDPFIENRLQKLRISHAGTAAVGLLVLALFYWMQHRMSRRLDKAKSHLQLAYLDALTLLPNRRYYDVFVRRELKRARRHGYCLSIIMIDIDYFKAYNDNLGHVAGDDCLRRVARTLKRYFRRSGDLIARYGGEEFCVVAACEETQARQLAEIMRAAIEMMQLEHPASAISKYVTISLGVAAGIPGNQGEFNDILEHADQALYAAKQDGRNRVEVYSRLTLSPASVLADDKA
ncbi:MAG: diguanylate cyclase [Methylomonas sp.]|nr:diguanylate cyclase [Methylomonas sp.]PPD20387.1 MAG: diguanylate cyclase [Methylomonas sp.]PPD25400.1 MAG: diguanylate cyclase [Methylomonas sp.]PPD35957.1 MAG: diguanylate cyclase [Methylomonas sp.]PPD40538.1 MAG: diguanylate cyclase [Methylomonas sp.]